MFIEIQVCIYPAPLPLAEFDSRSIFHEKRTLGLLSYKVFDVEYKFDTTAKNRCQYRNHLKTSLKL